MFCVSKDSPNPEEAAKFLNFFWTNEEANKVLANERGNTIFSNVGAALASSQTPQQVMVGDFIKLIGSFKTGIISVISPASDAEIQDQYKLLIEKVIYGEKTAAEAANEIFEFAGSKLQ
jgi:multiple sugar transport system substrate-binding protein